MTFFCMKSPSSRRLRAPLFFLAAALWACASPAPAADLVRRDFAKADYGAVRESLVEAIESEGLVPGPVSQFGDMLHRTDQSLRHGADLYAQAEIFSFCSIAVSSRLVRENPDFIADCPLTIALYRLKDSPRVSLVYRPREGTSPGAQAANALLERIASRTAAALPD